MKEFTKFVNNKEHVSAYITQVSSKADQGKADKSSDESSEKKTKKGAAAITINQHDDITPDQISKLRDLLNEFDDLFADKLGLVIEPEEDWMRIPLPEGTEFKIRPAKPYRLGPEERKMVDEVFDEQRRLRRLVDAKGSPTAWHVFVVKRGSKWHPAVDLRGLNQLIVPDAYPYLRQEDIVEEFLGMYWISLFDILSAYYQRRVHPDDWWKLAVATHRGHEMFTLLRWDSATQSHISRNTWTSCLVNYVGRLLVIISTT